MPFTPFHWGPMVLVLGLLSFLDPIGLFIGCVIPDVEGVFALVTGHGPLHGPFHSILGAFFLAILTSIGSQLFWYFLRWSKIEIPFFPEPNSKIIVCSAFIGSFSHILLDAFLYSEMNLLWPLPSFNPLYGLLSSPFIYNFCVICGILGIILLFWKLWKESINSTSKS
ncbi:MAG: DUF4184 family protein [Promethearchaeota archaeon]